MNDSMDSTACKHASIPADIMAPSEGVPRRMILLIDGNQCYGYENCALGHIPNSTACRAEMNGSLSS